MAILIFRRKKNSQDPLPYRTWLSGSHEPVVIFTTSEEPGDEDFAHVERFESFDTQGLTEVKAVEVANRFPYRRIFATSEHDLLRAAELRKWFGLTGQSLESTLAFRDKLQMKRLARAGGVATPEFVELRSPLDLYRFTAEHGYPCVVKPRTGAGARGVRILRSAEALRGFLREPLPANHMVESFVDGPMFHVDGLVADGKVAFICASRYIGQCINYQAGESSGTAQLDGADPVAVRLAAAARSVLASLPLPCDFVFHAEFFIDRSDRVVFCEIASRPGGAGITGAIKHSYGVDLFEQWFKRSAGLPIEAPAPHAWRPAGRLWVPTRRGVLRALPDVIPFDWVLDYRPGAKIGQRCEAATFSNELVAGFTVVGKDSEEVEARIRLLDRWSSANIEWDERVIALPA